MDTLGNHHCLGTVFNASGAEGLDVQFDDGEKLRLRSFTPIDSSIYRKGDSWSAEIVVCIVCERGTVFRPGIGLDFSEANVVTVNDPLTGNDLYQRGQFAPTRPKE